MSLAAVTDLPPLVAERPEDAPAVERLILRAFGPGRYAKTAERLREGRRPLLGPFAVDPDFRSQGLGAALIERACAASAADGHAAIVLVGDLPYFGPLGFSVAPAVVLPGPVDPRRVLARPLRDGADLALQGIVAAA